MSDRSFSPLGFKSRATSLHRISGDSVDPLFLIGGLPVISRHSAMSTSWKRPIFAMNSTFSDLAFANSSGSKHSPVQLS